MALRVAPLSLLVLLAFLSSAGEGEAGGRAGNVDWVNARVRAAGEGTAAPSGNKVKDRMMAVRAAEVTAQRALAETIGAVHVDALTRVRDAMAEDRTVTSRVQGVVRGARKIREEVRWEGDVPLAVVELEVCLQGDGPECKAGATVLDALPAERPTGYLPPLAGEVVVPRETGEAGRLASDSGAELLYDAARPATGLVLKAKGLVFERVLFPVVATRGEGGKLLTVYSARRVRPEVIRIQGVARYADGLEQARKSARLGDNPLVLPVTEVVPKENLLVIRPADAKVLRESTRYGNDFLAEGRVVIAGP